MHARSPFLITSLSSRCIAPVRNWQQKPLGVNFWLRLRFLSLLIHLLDVILGCYCPLVIYICCLHCFGLQVILSPSSLAIVSTK
jgi:hypothetical protein